MAEGHDPLKGFRGRPSADEYTRMEEELRSYRSLANDDIDITLLRDVIKADNLIADLKNESSTLQRLCTHAAMRIGEACKAWVESGDPTHPQVATLHRDARAARLLLDWVDDQIKLGQQAERQLTMRDLEDE